MTKIGAFLAQYSSKYIRTYPFPEKIDYILPIPLHPVKKRMRGFNQAEILSKEIANSLGVKHTPDLIVRKKFTQTQTKLKREERQKNVSEAFQVNRRFSLQNKVILIVDDVFTTGSTTNSISAILKKNEAKYVFVLTIARA
jgi:ComF family protein